MLPRYQDALLSDTQHNMDYINSVLCAALSGADEEEVVREFEDEYNYLSISTGIWPESGTHSVQIEFGVQSADARHAEGGLIADWSPEDGRIVGLRVMQLRGQHCSFDAFTRHLDRYASLPSSDAIQA